MQKPLEMGLKDLFQEIEIQLIDQTLDHVNKRSFLMRSAEGKIGSLKKIKKKANFANYSNSLIFKSTSQVHKSLASKSSDNMKNLFLMKSSDKLMARCFDNNKKSFTNTNKNSETIKSKIDKIMSEKKHKLEIPK